LLSCKKPTQCTQMIQVQSGRVRVFILQTDGRSSRLTMCPSFRVQAKELAVEFARRYLRHNIESLREHRSPEELRDHWNGFGECPVIKCPDGPPNLTLTDEMDYFFANPATPRNAIIKLWLALQEYP